MLEIVHVEGLPRSVGHHACTPARREVTYGRA